MNLDHGDGESTGGKETGGWAVDGSSASCNWASVGRGWNDASASWEGTSWCTASWVWCLDLPIGDLGNNRHGACWCLDLAVRDLGDWRNWDGGRGQDHGGSGSLDLTVGDLANGSSGGCLLDLAVGNLGDGVGLGRAENGAMDC